MSNLWDEQTILRKKFRSTADKKVEKKNALRTGNYDTVKKVNYNSNLNKLDNTEIEKVKTVGTKRGLLIRQARQILQGDKSQKALAKSINLDVNTLMKYENGTAIPDNKILIKLERKLNIKITGKEETWGKK